MKIKQADFLGADEIPNGGFLDEEYLMSFNHFDGWTRRLLSIYLHINKCFRYRIFIKYRRKNLDRTPVAIYIEDLLPEKIQQALLGVLNNETINLEKCYSNDNLFCTDAGSQSYIIKRNGKAYTIDVDGFAPFTEEYFDKDFLVFHRELLDWAMEFYEKIKQMSM